MSDLVEQLRGQPEDPHGLYELAAEELTRALGALHTLYVENASYINLNNLGPVHHNRSMQVAREVLAANGYSTWLEDSSHAADQQP